jgi:small-conductance mechanosensitive channel
MLVSMNIEAGNLALLLQDWTSIIGRIWSYLTRQFTFGQITISASGVIVGLVAIILSVLIARWSSALLEHRIANRRHIDAGLRYTICRLVRYLVISIGTVIALKQAFGLDLTSLAVIFTALSVGIGFGLQYIAADIASGFILLFERPIRIGDRITIGEDEGDVQSINLRTTIVTTNDHIAIIVPNSKLVTQNVVNWSYADPRARISIPVSVADDQDIQLVTSTLAQAAKNVTNVLPEPEPLVQFVKFGEYSLDFRLLVWTNQPRRHMQIRSDINYSIAKLFRERSIKLATPTQELRLQNVDARDFEPSLLRDNELLTTKAQRQ